MAKDELVDKHVSLHQSELAIKALHSHQTKKQAKAQENELLPGKEENIWLNVTVKRVSSAQKIKPIRIPIIHPIVDPRTTPVCLITKDPQREYKDLLETHKIRFVSRVVGIAKLKGKFRPFEARRMLLKENGLFLADDRVIPLLPKLLGSKWFEAKKQPIPVSLVRKDLKKELERAISSTYMNQNRGTCTSIKIGTLSQTPAQILENLKLALPVIVQHIKDGWDNIQSFHVKTNSSMSLPIWTCNLSDDKEGRWDGLTAQTSEDEEASDATENSEEEIVTPTNKKAEGSKERGKKRSSEGDVLDKPKKRARGGEDDRLDLQTQSSSPKGNSVSQQVIPSDRSSKTDEKKGKKKHVVDAIPTSSITKIEHKEKRKTHSAERKKEKILSSRGGRSIKAAVTGKRAARD
ncbi:hypothetical protein AX17_006229 [Amanita inopinata Kibby_2008]|nr:hypothetical protein AX17_006229 [Amanita inopinata Kibby_2008]